MGSVPNCQKEIVDRYPIRWFKCKLKPPKNDAERSETKNFFLSKIVFLELNLGKILKK